MNFVSVFELHTQVLAPQQHPVIHAQLAHVDMYPVTLS